MDGLLCKVMLAGKTFGRVGVFALRRSSLSNILGTVMRTSRRIIAGRANGQITGSQVYFEIYGREDYSIQCS